MSTSERKSPTSSTHAPIRQLLQGRWRLEVAHNPRAESHLTLPQYAGLAGRVISVQAARCLLLRAVWASQQELSVNEFTRGAHPSAIPTSGRES